MSDRSDSLSNLRQLPMADRALMALREAVAEVIEEHARLGIPIPIWRDGRIVDISPEEAEKRGFKRS